MGIEPTQNPLGPYTDFEDQGRHQAASRLRWNVILEIARSRLSDEYARVRLL